ncbi:MAG: hypothetical protein EBR34_08530 [Sphingomonadaceae bacterium]|nr:hypothetical protein [Sphingomonadaceae bacterium]
MRKAAMYLALFGILASGAELALADEMPPGTTINPAPMPLPQAVLGSSTNGQMDGVPPGGREQHFRRMQGHRMGMHHMRQPGMAAMAPAAEKPMQAGQGC